jgi:hypothetical protein
MLSIIKHCFTEALKQCVEVLEPLLLPLRIPQNTLQNAYEHKIPHTF